MPNVHEIHWKDFNTDLLQFATRLKIIKPSYLGAPYLTAQMFAEWLASAFVPWPLQWTPSTDVKWLVLGSRQSVVQRGCSRWHLKSDLQSDSSRSSETQEIFQDPNTSSHKPCKKYTPLHREMCKLVTWHDSGWFYIWFSTSLLPANSPGGWGRRLFGKFGSSLAVGGVESEPNSMKVNMDTWYVLLDVAGVLQTFWMSPGPASTSITSSGEASAFRRKDGEGWSSTHELFSFSQEEA